MKHLVDKINESLVKNVGLGPHIANEDFFNKLAKKRNDTKVDYFKRFVDYIGVDQDEVLKIMHDDEQKRLKQVGTQKEVITKDWFEWGYYADFKWVVADYYYRSEGGYQDTYFRNSGGDWFNFKFKYQELHILYNKKLQKCYDVLNTLFKQYEVYQNGRSVYRVYSIKDSIKDLTKI